MQGSQIENYIKECFEQHRNQLKIALEGIQNANDIFMKNVISLLSIRNEKEVIKVPKDKEEIGEREAKASLSPSSSSSSSESESSVQLEDDSSSSIAPPPLSDLLPEDQEDAENNYHYDDFVEDSSIEPVIYSKAVMDKATKEWIDEEVGNKKRNRKRAHHWSPDDHKHEKIGKSKTTYDGYVSRTDLKDFKDFQNNLSTVYGYDYIYRNSNWFQKKYGKAMETIINNSGHEGRNTEAKANFRLIIDRSLDSDNAPTIEKKRLGGPGFKICCLCGEKKNCPNTIWFKEITDHYGMTPHPIANCCAKLAFATIQFFKSIANEPFEKVDRLFQDVQEAHSKKGEERER